MKVKEDNIGPYFQYKDDKYKYYFKKFEFKSFRKAYDNATRRQIKDMLNHYYLSIKKK